SAESRREILGALREERSLRLRDARAGADAALFELLLPVGERALPAPEFLDVALRPTPVSVFVRVVPLEPLGIGDIPIGTTLCREVDALVVGFGAVEHPAHGPRKLNFIEQALRAHVGRDDTARIFILRHGPHRTPSESSGLMVLSR